MQKIKMKLGTLWVGLKINFGNFRRVRITPDNTGLFRSVVGRVNVGTVPDGFSSRWRPAEGCVWVRLFFAVPFCNDHKLHKFC